MVCLLANLKFIYSYLFVLYCIGNPLNNSFVAKAEITCWRNLDTFLIFSKSGTPTGILLEGAESCQIPCRKGVLQKCS